MISENNANRYQYLLFDLDHTLWDFDKNSELTLSEIFDDFNLENLSDFDKKSFTYKFREVNKKLWHQYNHGKIDSLTLRKTRFRLVLEKKSAFSYKKMEEISEFYMSVCPLKGCLIEGTIDVLEYLKDSYRLHIITNGFDDAQAKKMEHSGLNKYFDTVTTSQKAQAKKPSKDFFDFAISYAKVGKQDSIVIGDNFLADIEGAKNSGIDQVFFNPDSKKGHFEPTFTIQKLEELKSIL